MRAVARLLSAVLVMVMATVALAEPDRLSSAAKGINGAQAPVPAPLLEGKKVFVSFDPGDVLAFPSVYSGGPERAYDELYADMQKWNHYTLVLDPKDADLIFSVRFVESPMAWPQIRLVVSDAKTHVTLWAFVEQVNRAFFKRNRDQAFSNAVMALVNDVQLLIQPGSKGFFPVDSEGKLRKAEQ